MFIWSIDVCIDICRYVYSIYILYTGNYIHIHAIMDLKVGKLWSWHFCFADLFFCQTKMTKDPFLQVFLECRNPTMSSTLPSLIVLGTQRIPAVSVSKSRPELQKSPKFGGTKLQLENRGVFQCFPSRNLSRTSVAPAVAAGVSAFDFSAARGWWRILVPK